MRRLPGGAVYTKSPSLFSLRHLTHSEDGALIPRLTALASAMQFRQRNASDSQVSLSRAEALEWINHPQATEILMAGERLNILDTLDGDYSVIFSHRLMQEFFAARSLVQSLDATLVKQAWQMWTEGISIQVIFESLQAQGKSGLHGSASESIDRYEMSTEPYQEALSLTANDLQQPQGGFIDKQYILSKKFNYTHS